ncbi:MAG TPA: extensin family protein [Polyangiales bacterium]
MRSCSRALGVVLALLLSSACWPPAFAREDSSALESTYPLDDISRWMSEDRTLPCQDGSLPLTSYAGERVRYARPVRVHPAFRARLSAFDALLVEVAEEHFGRAPRRLLHFGAYVCRAMRGREHLISEHALGNALDLAGFEFGPLPRGKLLPASAPRGLRAAFQVSIQGDWQARGKRAPQAEFLRDLAARLMDRPDIFRSFVGPGWPGHDNHFHLAVPPYRLVKLGDTVRWLW